jgi:hypothetical protein
MQFRQDMTMGKEFPQLLKNGLKPLMSNWIEFLNVIKMISLFSIYLITYSYIIFLKHATDLT